ncbi:hypothetical protein J2I47_13000 [Fibrella sp. HMF5335]|uniref:DUF3300 domain-containing protein n=1 Tax=Fibrella rubiginis TaxID=2817060 RepID=A0A939GE71_9BACT|nr:hypothetical protein [Fibrella rubiginis]MBO0937467.1 hypothetical protein [Fibrella rubiginis]
MNTFKKIPLATAILLGLGLFAPGQAAFAQMPDTNRPSATADTTQTFASVIAPFRDDIRQSVLLASQHPDVLGQLAKQQASSQQAFLALIEPFGQTKQGWFYDMARFPDLMHTLATLPDGTDRTTVDGLTKALPADLQTPAWKLYRHHHDDLVQADNLNQQANQAFDNLIAPLDGPTQTAFRQLINTPDVLTTLTQQLDKTAQLGRDYTADPAAVTRNLTALHDSLDAQNKQELAAYQQELNQDPQARQELQQAAQDYAHANGYKTGGINRNVGPPNPAWPVNSSYYYQNPYSFWFGYPGWYGSPFWYPSAYWLNTGFYYGPSGNMVVVGLPGFGFSNWFFGGGYYGYPSLYNRFGNYYGRTYSDRRLWGGGNYGGFMGAAHRTYGPMAVPGRGNWNMGGAGVYSRGNGGFSSGGRMAAPSNRSFNGGTFRAPSTGNFGGGRSFGGGGGFGGGRGRR